MPIAKNGTNGAVATPPAETAPVTTARKLDTGTPLATNGRDDKKSRDYDAEARGKVACAAFNGALMSPGLAGLGFANYDEYMVYVKKAADASVAYTWEHQK